MHFDPKQAPRPQRSCFFSSAKLRCQKKRALESSKFLKQRSLLRRALCLFFPLPNASMMLVPPESRQRACRPPDGAHVWIDTHGAPLKDRKRMKKRRKQGNRTESRQQKRRSRSGCCYSRLVKKNKLRHPSASSSHLSPPPCQK